MNVNIPRARRFPRQRIIRPPDWIELAKRWAEVKRPEPRLTPEQFAIAD